MTPPTLRTDIIDAYVARRCATLEWLQLRRTRDPMRATWQPVMGHIEQSESATECLWRELHEETMLTRDNAIHAWALEQTHPYFLSELDCVVLSPRFCIEVDPTFEPTLNDEHDAARWVADGDVGESFMWPSQRSAILEARAILNGHTAGEHLRLR